MKPTAKLRFIQRQVEIDGDHKLTYILQQWWESGWGSSEKGEWRDVPLEQE